ncbi:putative bifunctional diguanylate cyclase/phosphodiesterase [Ilumatobacter coccineus]|jgi:diguanylate cyclase (GGDEF)-like protein/PAS domain S-box-containing protein|nr:sensor domain-containing phosphodiesterase [Ilumatobacter coccineus]
MSGVRPVPEIDHLGDPVIAVDANGLIQYVNTTATATMAWSERDVLGLSVLELVHPDDLNLAIASLGTVGDKSVGDLIAVRVRTGTSEWKSLEVRGAQHLVDGEPMTVMICRDTTFRHRLDLDQGEVAVLRAVMANMHGMIAIVNADGRVRSINGAVTRILGHDPEVLPGQGFLRFVHPDDRAQVFDIVSNLGSYDSAALDARFLTAGGDDFVTCEFTVNNLTDDPTLGGFVVSGQVAAALSDARERVDFLADHDSRTGLLNRDGFMKSARELMRAGGGLGLMVIDVVQFRSINELYGERVGDRVLAAVADRIDLIRWPDLITARFGGDEFVLAVRSSSDSAIEMLRERVRREVAQAVLVDDQEINIGVRTATAFEPQPRLESLLASASNELMRVKRNADPETGGISFDAINERRQQLDQLRAALDAGEIQPFFQPIVSADGTVTAVEALVRWVHPVRGVLGVGEILPLAQMAGLMGAVDDRVLEQSLAFAAQLDLAGFGYIEVHVNVDPKVISQASFATKFLEKCAEFGANSAQIVIELTETDLLAPGATSLNNMQDLRRAGIHVSIDDFGTGYSSLSHLLELPVDGVKIDRRFVAGIDVDPAATNLTTAILGLSESLQLGCVAEGVEQPYQLERLASLGCNAFQGWLFAPAVAPDELIELLPRIDAVPVTADA